MVQSSDDLDGNLATASAAPHWDGAASFGETLTIAGWLEDQVCIGDV
jgi:hypothetical protein